LPAGSFKYIRFSISQKESTNEPLDRFLWASILEGCKVLRVVETTSWFFGIHEQLQLDQISLVCVSSIHLVNLLYLGKGIVWFLRTEGGKAAEDLENLLIAIVHIDLAQQLM
jgi:hypothetical protein